MKSLTQRKKALLVFFGIALISLGMGMFEYNPPPPNEQTPPLAQTITVQRLKEPDAQGNNVLLFAKFKTNTLVLKDLKELKVNVDSSNQLVFFDDGTHGDKEAGDKVFTIPLRIAEDELLELVKKNNQSIAGKKNQETVFVMRSAVTRKLAAFDIERFRAGLEVPFDLVTSSLVSAATLPSIRDKSLIIRDVSVVEDKTRTYDPCRVPKGNPNGVWSFKRLIANMANTPSTGITAEQFLINWVDNFLFSAQVHPGSGDATVNRNVSKERLVKAWIKNSGLPVPVNIAGWQGMALKAEEFPVRLLAIVNRLDLRGNSGYGFSNAGEGRLVFCFVDSNNNCFTGNNGPGTMTIIFEYGIPISNCVALKNYAQQWWNLQILPFGPIYNNSLAAITNVFTAANAAPLKPNRSALNHLRTNDFIQAPWDIRDFLIDAATHHLKMVHPNREPMAAANSAGPANPNNTALVAFVNGLVFPLDPNDPAPVYSIPNNLAGMQAPMPNPNHRWRGSVPAVMNATNRRGFSFNTCSSCHTRETRNVFTHIKPRNVNAPAAISGFLSGIGADDNAGDGADVSPVGKFFVTNPGPGVLPQAQFNESLRRAIDLENLLFNTPCLPVLQTNSADMLVALHHVLKFSPVNMED